MLVEIANSPGAPKIPEARKAFIQSVLAETPVSERSLATSQMAMMDELTFETMRRESKGDIGAVIEGLRLDRNLSALSDSLVRIEYRVGSLMHAVCQARKRVESVQKLSDGSCASEELEQY